MTETTRTRVRRRLQRAIRRPPGAAPTRLTRARGLDDPRWGDDLDGGAGVREPRRPYPNAPAGALELDEPDSQHLDLVG